MNIPVVSVCIATYNQGRYIKDCIVSAVAQIADTSIEVLVGDDGDDPETTKIVEDLSRDYPGIIQYYKHERNVGPAANYQFLIERARGNYVAHLDGDDMWMPGKLLAQIRWLEAHPESMACYTNAVVVSDTQEVRGAFSSPVIDNIDLDFLLSKGNFLNHSSMLYRASCKQLLLDINGPFIDYRIHLNMANLNYIGLLNAAYVVYRVGSEHSMVRRTPGLVQDLYFDAISLTVNMQKVSVKVRRRALRNFWRHIVMECIVNMRLRWALSWAKKIKFGYPNDFTIVLISGAVEAFGSVVALVIRRYGGQLLGLNNLRILNER